MAEPGYEPPPANGRGSFAWMWILVLVALVIVLAWFVVGGRESGQESVPDLEVELPEAEVPDIDVPDEVEVEVVPER